VDVKDVTQPFPLVRAWTDTGETPTIPIPKRGYSQKKTCCASERAPGHRFCRICGAPLWLKTR
jgi:hypothetical protein